MPDGGGPFPGPPPPGGKNEPDLLIGWQGRLRIELTQAVLETASPALVHSPLYPAFTYPPEQICVLSNARFNAGKSNGSHPEPGPADGTQRSPCMGLPQCCPCTLSALRSGVGGGTRTRVYRLMRPDWCHLQLPRYVAGMAGFGPAHEGVKVPCLTAWLHPCMKRPRHGTLR